MENLAALAALAASEMQKALETLKDLTDLVNSVMGTSKNSGSVRTDQRDPPQQLEWMEPKATPVSIFRGALMQKALEASVTAKGNQGREGLRWQT
jgi:hypothetical protein